MHSINVCFADAQMIWSLVMNTDGLSKSTLYQFWPQISPSVSINLIMHQKGSFLDVLGLKEGNAMKLAIDLLMIVFFEKMNSWQFSGYSWFRKRKLASDKVLSRCSFLELHFSVNFDQVFLLRSTKLLKNLTKAWKFKHNSFLLIIYLIFSF